MINIQRSILGLAVLMVLVVTCPINYVYADQKEVDAATEELKTLSVSMKSDDIEKIRELTKNGADVNVRNEYNATPLIKASGEGYAEIVKLLLEAKADVNAATNADASTPLYIASGNGHTEVVKLLLEAKANINAVTTNGLTPLYIASFQGHTEVVKLLIEAKANVNAARWKLYGLTPLWAA